MNRFGRALYVVGLLAAEVAAVVALQRIGRVEGFAVPHRAVAQWLTRAPTEDLVAVAARLAGLVLAWWLLVATLLSVARRVVPGWQRIRALDAITPIALRRVVDRTVAIGIGASFVVAGFHPAGAATSAVARRADVPVVRAAPPPSQPTPPKPTPAAHPVVPAAATVIVRPGDNLWVIAGRALRTESPAHIAPYWRRLIAANAASLRSGDPNLIFPGERIVLPPATG